MKKTVLISLACLAVLSVFIVKNDLLKSDNHKVIMQNVEALANKEAGGGESLPQWEATFPTYQACTYTAGPFVLNGFWYDCGRVFWQTYCLKGCGSPWEL